MMLMCLVLPEQAKAIVAEERAHGKAQTQGLYHIEDLEGAMHSLFSDDDFCLFKQHVAHP